ncbi:MAG: DNA oxidative demethylase AlkB [Gammaproteobacteria bacterium]|nr:DNA oxidative demethylase AlkB [Gammaproteobacteria bacterium]
MQAGLFPPELATEVLAPGACVLRGFALDAAPGLLAAIAEIARAAPFRHMTTPGGFRMSVAMTSCGALGWVTDATGYRYAAHDPESGGPWPAMPEALLAFARRAAAAAGHADCRPDACLVNRYAPGTKLSLHQDRDERDHGAPIVSVSLGLPAVFLFGGARRKDPQVRVPLAHGDVVVWGGASRLFHHGVLPIAQGHHPATGAYRYNLTFRKAG